jgi:HEPN domain-containing protein
MSQSKAKYEANRWLLTAKEDLQAATALKEANMFAHACFMAQQSGEKALKALWFGTDNDPWGHSIQKLVMQFPQPDLIGNSETWITNAAALDKFYIPTRYPNGLPDLTPGQTYVVQDATGAIEKEEQLKKRNSSLSKLALFWMIYESQLLIR